ncbi:MAG: MBOAT family protein [Mariprofundaceae bacterium]
MLFNSTEFIFFFLPTVVAVFYLLRLVQPLWVSVCWLVMASLFFYGWWNPAYLLIIAASIFFNYSIGIALDRLKNGRFSVLTLGVIGNLALLGYFKYTNFLVDNANTYLHSDFHVQNIILPLAISFFTFQQIAYIVDTYRRKDREMDFLRYCLFVTFFPQLIAGPIVHHNEMMPQFSKLLPRQGIPLHIAIGISIFIIGLFKKVVLADGAAMYASPVFDAAASGVTLSFFEAWFGTFAYTLQIYFDFSGYSDMAIGLARMFGIRLPINFDSPYKAKNIIDFWRRWHITLSRFLRDYLYFPLGGNRKGHMRRHVNLITVMLLGGIWHGAGWTFAVWGLLHGSYLLCNHAWHDFRARMGFEADRSTWLGRCFAQMITMFAVMIAWVFFRSADLSAANSVLRSMFGLNHISLLHSLQAYCSPAQLQWLHDHHIRFGGMFYNGLADFNSGIIWIFALFIIVLVFPNTQSMMRHYKPTIGVYNSFGVLTGAGMRWRINMIYGLVVGSAFFIICTKWLSAAPSEFIYFNF